ncbi:hypothetical protein V1525DRAFT_394303 [Lipomyces kononenkoae]|uniref:Uncharacterized protein n=1 Tax=Lipomyces kononenkoae TaxID=34357 RepID=A0ACC3TDE9_LIPKO
MSTYIRPQRLARAVWCERQAISAFVLRQSRTYYATPRLYGDKRHKKKLNITERIPELYVQNIRDTPDRAQSLQRKYRAKLDAFRQEARVNNLQAAWPLYRDLKHANVLEYKDIYDLVHALQQSIRSAKRLTQKRSLDRGNRRARNTDFQSFSILINELVEDIKGGVVPHQDSNSTIYARILTMFDEMDMQREAIVLWNWLVEENPTDLKGGLPYAAMMEVYVNAHIHYGPGQTAADIRQKKLQVCEMLLQEYRKNCPDSVARVYVSMAYARSMLGNPEGALEVWQELKSRVANGDIGGNSTGNIHMEPLEVLFYKYMIMSPFNMALATEHFREALNKGIALPASAVSTFFSNAAAARMDHAAILELVNEYDASPVAGNSQYHMFMVHCIENFFEVHPLATTETVEKLYELIQLLYEQSLKYQFHVVAFNTVISKLSTVWHRVDIVDAVLQGMGAAKIAPSIVTYRILTMVYSHAGELDKVRQCWLKLVELQKQYDDPDKSNWTSNFHHLIKATTLTGDWQFLYAQSAALAEFATDAVLVEIMKIDNIRNRPVGASPSSTEPDNNVAV